LTQDFGKPDDADDWDPLVCEKMQSLIKLSLAEGVKEEYDSKEGLVHLYKRAGGKVTAKMKVTLMFGKSVQSSHDFFLQFQKRTMRVARPRPSCFLRIPAPESSLHPHSQRGLPRPTSLPPLCCLPLTLLDVFSVYIFFSPFFIFLLFRLSHPWLLALLNVFIHASDIPAQPSFADSHGAAVNSKDKKSETHPLMKVLYEYFKLNAEKASLSR
jgi:hypothetical protein